MLAAHLRAIALLAAATIAGCNGCGKPSGASDAGAPASTAPEVATVRWEPAARDAAIAEGRAVLEKHQCARCHVIDDLPSPARPLHCTECHQFLTGLKPGDSEHTRLVHKYGADVIARYQKNIRHLVQVPNLTNVAKRVKPAFLASFLREPFDLRPALEESMIRHHLSEAEIKSVVRYFAARALAADPFEASGAEPAPSRPSDARIEQGKKLFFGRGCTACHTFGNIDTGMKPESMVGAGLAIQLAPNLRFVRDRTRSDAIVAWIMEPSRLLPGTMMPAMGLSRDEAEAVKDFLVFGDPRLKPASRLAEPAPPKILDRTVTYAEMKERVLGRICVHCHMNDYEKDPGPGNRGGLGYAGTRLQMRTYETLVYGAVDEHGERYSVLVPKKGETVPPIVKAMLRRRVEEARDRVLPFDDHERPHYPDGPPGMPLGLPSMSDEEIAILETWIAQGCHGPTEATGKPGVDDGYLVPDGPIAKNEGCELRAPNDKKRPVWPVH